VNGIAQDAEIQIHHESDDGTMAVVSILLDEDEKADSNGFLTALEAENWIKEDGKKYVIDDKDLFIEELTKGGL